MSLPPPREILSSVRSSCASVSLPVDPTAIDDFIHSVSEPDWNRLSQNHGVRLPLKFDAPLVELNFLATLGLLNFLSGYRQTLHRLTGRGAYSTILSLLLSDYLSSSSPSSSILSTRGMLNCTPSSLAQLAQIQTHAEKDHPTLGPAVRVGTKDEEAFEVLELLEGVLKETGRVLEGLEMENLGEWIARELERCSGDSSAMIHSMATTFPAFKDVHIVRTIEGGEDTTVYLFKKALWTLNAIYSRFSPNDQDEESKLKLGFPVPRGIKEFPIFADNVIPSLLIHYKILPSSTTSSSSTILRASSVNACHLIVQRAHELAAVEEKGKGWLRDWNEVGLDGYLWSLAKEGGRREGAQRVVEERGTIYY